MSKIVDSVLSIFNVTKRPKKSQNEGKRRGKNKNRKSVLDADSFVYLPGQEGENWGELVGGSKDPLASLAGDYSWQCEMRRRTKTVDDNALRSGKLFSRRLSGTLVSTKGRRSLNSLTEVEDGSIRVSTYLAVPESARRPRSQDLSDRYVYDRLIRVPTRSSRQSSNRSSQQIQGSSQELAQPSSSSPKQGKGRERDRENMVFEIRCNSGNGGYCDIVPVSDCSWHSYAVPADAVDWEAVRQQLKECEDDYATVRDPERPLLGKAIGPREVLLGDKIGEGQFGDVHKGILYPDTQEETMVAVKTCKVDASHEERAKFLEEAAVMHKFNHPHIIKLFGVVSHEQATYIVMELAPLGQLRRYLLTEGSRISKAALLDYVQQLSSAMLHLEAKNYVHRDIAARNVLVSSPEVVKLADFGLSRGLEDHDYYVASRGKLPIKWMAPESINFRRFTGLSDVWMFGVCCWEILMRGVKPFVGIKNDEVISKIEMGERLPLPPECPAPLFRLMTLCWEYDPAERPNFIDIERTINEIVEEERQLDLLTQRRGFGGIQRDPNAPEKPRRPPSSQQLRQVSSDPHLQRLSAVSVDEFQTRRLSDNVEERGEDNALPLPPRLASRFRDLSVSPTPDRGSPTSTGSDTPPPKPPRKERSTGNLADAERERERERDRQRERERLDHPPPLPIEPYKVTTITPVDPDAAYSTISRDSQSPIPVITAPIPPPSIIRQPPRRDSNSDTGVYYSIPTETLEGGSTRMLSDRGVFVDQELRTSHGSLHSSMESGRSRPGEGSSDDSQGRSSPLSEERVDDTSFLREDDEFVQKTTAVVKSVMELSNKVPLCRPADYVELVKNVGLALRDLLSNVDEVLTDLPQQTHNEVSMAHKVLSSDMNNLVQAMASAQKHYQTFLEQDYQKQMLRAAHVVAMNAKQLLDAVNNARRKALLMQR